MASVERRVAELLAGHRANIGKINDLLGDIDSHDAQLHREALLELEAADAHEHALGTSAERIAALDAEVAGLQAHCQELQERCAAQAQEEAEAQAALAEARSRLCQAAPSDVTELLRELREAERALRAREAVHQERSCCLEQGDAQHSALDREAARLLVEGRHVQEVLEADRSQRAEERDRLSRELASVDDGRRRAAASLEHLQADAARQRGRHTDATLVRDGLDEDLQQARLRLAQAEQDWQARRRADAACTAQRLGHVMTLLKATVVNLGADFAFVGVVLERAAATAPAEGRGVCAFRDAWRHFRCFVESQGGVCGSGRWQEPDRGWSRVPPHRAEDVLSALKQLAVCWDMMEPADRECVPCAAEVADNAVLLLRTAEEAAAKYAELERIWFGDPAAPASPTRRT